MMGDVAALLRAPQCSQTNKISKIKWSQLLQVKAFPHFPVEPTVLLILIHTMMFLSKDQGSDCPSVHDTDEAAPQVLYPFPDPALHERC